jgi:murein DD-endopeptidase MepM/ murein hydrolase activator NlpD
MDHQYCVLEFAHSVSGRVKRIHLSPRFFLYGALGSLLLFMTAAGLFASYLRMSWKLAHYNQLRSDFDHLRTRYKELQRVSHQHSEQMASLETLASEVSVAYGINPPATEASSEAKDYGTSLMPDAKESIQEFNFLKAASYSGIYHHYAFPWQSHSQPSLWPINGLLRSSFGGRWDPFSGEGAFHTGVDLAAPVGTPVHVTADGIVVSAGWSGRYGKLVVVDHGNRLQTYYAHLSQFLVVPGQEVRRNQMVALSGRTGRATGPHVHYEVRLGGTPVNPYKYLSKLQLASASRVSHNDLGL